MDKLQNKTSIAHMILFYMTCALIIAASWAITGTDPMQALNNSSDFIMSTATHMWDSISNALS